MKQHKRGEMAKYSLMMKAKSDTVMRTLQRHSYVAGEIGRQMRKKYTNYVAMR